MGLVATLFISDVNEKSEDNKEMAKEVEMVPGIMKQVSNSRGLQGQFSKGVSRPSTLISLGSPGWEEGQDG